MQKREREKMVGQGFLEEIDTDFFDDLLDFPNEEIGGGDVGGLEGGWPSVPEVLVLSDSSLSAQADGGSICSRSQQSVDDDLAALSVPVSFSDVIYFIFLVKIEMVLCGALIEMALSQ